MILIIGAGISGLTLAYELEKKGIDYLLVESDVAAGGYMKSIYVTDFLLELGPNTVLANAELKAFFYELGLDDQMLIPESKSKKRYVFKDGRLRKLPSGPLSFLFGNFFSWKTKKAIFKEMSLKSSGKSEETVGAFFERRFNKELVDYAINPFVSGIFAGDPYQLLIDKTFPFLPGLEKKYGSVVKGFMKSKSGSGKKETIIFRNGINSLINALAEKCRFIRYNSKVLSVKKNKEGFKVGISRNGEVQHILADKIVVTSSSFATAELLKEHSPELSEQISKIHYCPMVKVFLGFKKKDIGLDLQGFGALNPACERQFSLGTIWNSSINPFSCPGDSRLFTVMVGGVNNEDKTLEGDSNIISKVCSELKRIYKISANPSFTYVYKLPKAIPQYDNGMTGMETVVDKLREDQIFICTNWYNGASVSDCIKKATQLSALLSQEVLV